MTDSYNQPILVERDTNDPQPVAGTDLGGGAVAVNMLPYVLDANGSPVQLTRAALAAVGGGTGAITVEEPSYAHMLAFGVIF